MMPPPNPGDPTDGFRGWRLLQGRSVQARFDLPDAPIATVPAPSDGIIYAPTATPPHFPCMEVTAAHYNDRHVYNAPYGDAFAVWDWCNNTGNFRYWANSSAYAFRDPDVRSYTDDHGLTKKGFYVEVLDQNPSLPDRTYDCWSAMIYNFNNGMWEEKWTSCGISQRSDAGGWIMHETLGMAGTRGGVCYSMKSIAADWAFIMMPDGFWYGPYDQYNGAPILDEGLPGPPLCWANGTWSFSTLPEGGWRVYTPGYVW